MELHDLRHTCAILLLTEGVHPKIVSEMLGHSSIAITLDVYSHVIQGLGDAAALAMEDVVGRRSRCWRRRWRGAQVISGRLH
jgi:integrase